MTVLGLTSLIFLCDVLHQKHVQHPKLWEVKRAEIYKVVFWSTTSEDKSKSIINLIDLIRLEFVTLTADAATESRFFCETYKLLEQRIIGLHLALLVGLKSDGLQLLGTHGHGQFLLLGLGVVSNRFDLEFENVIVIRLRQKLQVAKTCV